MAQKLQFEDLILFQDDNYIVVNKPPFLSTLEDRQDKVNLLGLARQYEDSAQVCHRLDKDTSGVLVIGRNPEAYRHLSIQFDIYGGKPFYLSQVKKAFNLKKDTVEEPFMKRMALHAFSVEFDNLNGERITVEAPYQKDMQALVRQLELNH
jgi:23S rRNA-/tRNA-specific pseudouridylate synthase